MKVIKSATFLKSEVNFENYKGFDLPEIVLLGRSNVGKSSFINMLSNNSGSVGKIVTWVRSLYK